MTGKSGEKALSDTSPLAGFVRATYKNKDFLYEAVKLINASDMANYSNAFDFAFKLFATVRALVRRFRVCLPHESSVSTVNIYNVHIQHRKSAAYRERGYGAGCQEVIYLLSDGGTAFPKEVLEHLNWNISFLGTSWIQPAYASLCSRVQCS